MSDGNDERNLDHADVLLTGCMPETQDGKHWICHHLVHEFGTMKAEVQRLREQIDHLVIDQNKRTKDCAEHTIDWARVTVRHRRLVARIRDLDEVSRLIADQFVQPPTTEELRAACCAATALAAHLLREERGP